MNLNSIASDICPLEGRRKSREVYVKLIVLNFAVLLAYAKLLRTRRKPYVLFRLIIFFFWPLAMIWSIVSPVAVILIEAIISVGDGRRVRELAALMLGIEPEESWLYELRPLEVKVQAPQPDHRPQKTRRGTITSIALVIQSFVSIWLFKRRYDMDVVFPFDIYLLHLTIGGLCVGLLQVAQPFLPGTESQEQWYEWRGWVELHTPRTGRPWLTTIRHKLPEALLTPEASILWELVAAVWITVFATSPFLPQDASLLLPSSTSKSASNVNYFVSSGAWAALVALIFSMMYKATLAFTSDTARPAFGADLLYLPLILFMAVSSSFIWFWGATCSMIFLRVVAEPVAMCFGNGGVPRLGICEISEPCPGAWRDPLAGYMWWLV